MSILVAIMLFGWVPFAIFCFSVLDVRKAILVTLIGGWLFLPHIPGYDLPGMPPYDKNMAIAIALIVGSFFSSGKNVEKKYKRERKRIIKLLMAVWCFCPIITSFQNGLGLYDGISSSFENIINWAIPFGFGMRYFIEPKHFKMLCNALILGGMIYVPLCLFEVRMSPQLNNIIYDFFPHSWGQHFRYGGWRPIVFMQHGLMVALWMSLTTVTAFWLWRSKKVVSMVYIPIGIVFVLLFVTTILCKSKGAFFLMILGCSLLFFFKHNKIRLLLMILLLSIPVFLGLRAFGIMQSDQLVIVASRVFDQERIDSLNFRLTQEDYTISHTKQRKWFGWGGFGRNRPDLGQYEKSTLDSLWIITFSVYGFVGLISLFAIMLYGPWRVIQHYRKRGFYVESSMVYPVLLSCIVILFMIDQLLNKMVNPIFILISGALAVYSVNCRESSWVNLNKT